MKNIGLKATNAILISLLILTGIIFIGSALNIKNEITASKQFWNRYQDITSSREQAITDLVKNLGYGGMIHQFKNYVLRKDQKRIPVIESRIANSINALDHYKENNLSTAEREALVDIKLVIKAYEDNKNKIQTYVLQGLTAKTIDQRVKIDDGPALEGISILISETQKLKHSIAEGQTKTSALSDVRAALGFGGMIHQFKNYVLRNDEKRIAKIEQHIASALKGLDDYRTLGVNDTEEQALTDIASVIQAYKDSIKTIQQLINEGKSVEAIDSAVKISDRPALNGFSTLRQEISLQTEAEKQKLTASLDATEATSLAIIIIAVLSSAFLVILSYSLLTRRVINPISRMTTVMESLATGNHHVAIDTSTRHDEIGKMMQTIAVFKDNMIKAKTLTEQQAHETAEKEQHRQRLEAEIQQFQHDILSILQTLTDTQSSIHHTALDMSDGAGKTREQSDSIGSAVDDTRSTMDTVAAATHDLLESINTVR